MNAVFKIKQVRTIYILYWFLLAYIIAALIWWFIALNQQNLVTTDYKIGELDPKQSGYNQKLNRIQIEKRHKTFQYIGEGVTFFLLIIAGAVFVFREVRRKFRQSQQQQNFMIAITHELKTPIAITKLNLETLQKYKLDDEKKQRLIYNTIREANRLNALCNNMLLASQLEGEGYRLTIETIDLSKLVTECTNDFIIRFPERNIQTTVEPGISINGDMLLWQIAINNLLDNAVKYSPKDGNIYTELKKSAGITTLSVKDEGKGIPAEEQKKIFKKFYRLGNLYTKGAKGTGLGLYLTKRIVQQHKGNIFVTNNQPQGSIFEITF